MKKLLIIGLILLGLGVAISANEITPENINKQAPKLNYVDKDNDGICDNRQNHHQNNCQNYIDEDDDNVCDNHKHHGNGGQRHGGKHRNCHR